jgi:hypothetical protein
MLYIGSNIINNNKDTRVDQLTAVKIKDLLEHMTKNYTQEEIIDALHLHNINEYCKVIINARNKRT